MSSPGDDDVAVDEETSTIILHRDGAEVVRAEALAELEGDGAQAQRGRGGAAAARRPDPASDGAKPLHLDEGD